MIKAILFDVDGVLIKRREYFSERFSREQNIPLELILEFFKNEFKQCSLGKADLKEELKKYLDRWNWKGSVDELLEYWFAGESEIDTYVLSAIDELRAQGKLCYLATNQEQYRKQYLLENLGLKNHFDGCFASCDTAHSKKEKEFYDEVFKKLEGIEREEIVFLDSDQEIVDVANSVGIQGKLYRNFDMIKDLS